MPSKSGIRHRVSRFFRAFSFGRARKKLRELQFQQQRDVTLSGLSKTGLRGDRRRTVIKKKYKKDLRSLGYKVYDRYASGLLDSSPGRRIESLRLAGYQAMVSLQPVVARLIRDEDPRVRAMAVIVLAKFEETMIHANNAYYHDNFFTPAIPLIRKRLGDENPTVRYNASVVLGILNDTDSLPAIRPLLQDNSPKVRNMAQTILTAIGDREDKSVEKARAHGGAIFQLREAFDDLAQQLSTKPDE